MTIKKIFIHLLIYLGIKKAYSTYKGQKVTKFKYNRMFYFNEYRNVLLKKSNLPVSKRNLIRERVEDWIVENKIDVKKFQDELRDY